MRFVPLLLLLVTIALPSQAQPAEDAEWAAYLPPEGDPTSPLGFWRGVITRDGASQIIELDITRNDTMAVDSGAVGLAVYCMVPDWFAWPGYTCGREATFADGTLTTGLLYGLQVSMQLDPVYGELYGVVKDTATPVTAHFRRATRPAEPAIRETEMTVENGEVSLAGTLVTPDGAGPRPVVVFIHGRGAGRRAWGSYGGQAEAVARHGIAGFVYDKRGVAASTGDFEGSNLYDHADDVAAIMQALAARPDIDAEQIGLLGSSAGGWVATIVQAESPIRPAFVVTRVGPFESVFDQQWHVAEAFMREGDYTPEQIEAAIEYVKLESGTDASDAAVEAMREGARRAEAEGWDDILVDPPMTREALEATWARVNRYDPADDLERLTMPLLAFFGEDDYVVLPDYNVPVLEAAMAANGNDDVTIVVHPGMGHGLENPNQLLTFEGDRSTRYHYLWNRIAAGYGETLIAWLLDHVTLPD